MNSMHQDDLRTFTRIGNAFWTNSEHSRKFASDTLAAVCLLDLTPERAFEKACAALLDCARRTGAASNTLVNSEVISRPFFRLSPEERLVLIALHQARLSYEKLGRILKLTPEQVQELAWKARLLVGARSTYPAGPSRQGLSCPEYDPRHPWTQKFLDEELESKREQFFLQNHLLACDSCRDALTRCRNLYFQVDREVSRVSEDSDLIQFLKKVLRDIELQKFPSHRSFLDSLRIFSRREDVQWLLWGIGFVLIFRACQIFSRLLSPPS